MYPDFYHLLKDLFGIHIPVLSLFKTFGFLVAISFFAAGFVLYSELKRKEQMGLIGFRIEQITVGKKPGIFDYLISVIIGFLLGYKIVGMVANLKTASADPLSFIISKNGSITGGMIAAAIALAVKFYLESKNKAEVVGTKNVKTYPHTRVGDMAVIAAIGGFAGAKIFNAFETWDSFIQDPIGNLFSSSGLTFYGGLIVATFALWYYARKINLDFRHLCDAAAPGLILAYGIGRLGCQVSGDGDWGIYNSAYITDSVTYKVRLADKPFEQSAIQYRNYAELNEQGIIPHKSFVAPSFIPTNLVAYNYPKNVGKNGIQMKNVNDEYNTVLPLPVYPTPVYEFLMGLIIFFLLWFIRKKFTIPLSIFSIYLIFNGIERFLIEQFRVNYKYDFGFIHPTQAEIIAVCISLCGVLLFLFRGKINQAVNSNSPTA